ncbi:MerR family transcriptional regulator [Clostridium sardiniense]|uniref:MerR family transcriptional regulator n=1 Tax=Clostridium sardiniense TaxID=29369 RepID=UPI001958BF90|nr:MerR family transcriptional regulator [Clostridium sardiniense]MBM7834845.1 DNA-binding transcriptional MerR regulator [Clostridium sardiniense]
MEYTIKEVANKTNLSTYTIRYYEKEGLLPTVSRDKAGNRVFSDDDLEWISIVCCLKNTGMPIKDIKTYMDLKKEGDSTLEVRRTIVTDHKKAVENKISQLMKELKKVNEKVKYYDTACEDGTEAFVKNKCKIQKIRMK